ncbi:Mrp/NBP35 family ATP-binding protein [Herbiconiux sp. L3-i23]|uniref:Mrp/NBP35 family ATP-binding protein n=1 Tax=Herbiconiux sp. L3-i23 TaxID=2905871 RepID=UPI0020694470|nr:Mrp/NBP35 family ATP-binding protein [Herbiconiux sp. L3-i23]BDI23463.1 iron-sulfur cluster carrier protein [Herbiconiux sp. L3-i23]
MSIDQTVPEAPLVTAIRERLRGVIDPEIRKSIVDLGMVGGIAVDDAGRADVEVRLTIVGCPAADRIERDVHQAVASVDGVSAATVDVTVMTPKERTDLTSRLRGSRPRGSRFGPESLTRVFAVTSGKGGVGKSTLTANLAVALASRGLAVGLIDADVYGFSIPGILGVDPDATPTKVGELMLPPVAHGVKVISIGMFLTPEQRGQAVAWRGPMLHRTVAQFVTDVFFGDLDVLLLDLPPGTGDVAISVGQLLPNAEVLVVTTPQNAAADVAERSGTVARQTGQKVVGVIENMAGLPQPDGSILELFGSGGGAETARRLSAGGEDVPLLGSIPLSVDLRTGGDTGRPIVLTDPEDPAAKEILRIADSLAVRKSSLAGKALPLSPR